MKRPDNAVQADLPAPRQSGAEPIPGYRLLEPLGSGGFGEVWKCEAPGGLLKAIKFVRGNAQSLEADYSPADQELDALRRIKAIRHPFILSLERLEVLGGELVIVMELADRSLHEVLAECRRRGQAGIPRDDLLAYLLEAAEALDVMNFRHGLQHLDIKPGNLFVVSDHLKVGDFGLVNSPEEFRGEASAQRNGVTPLYAAPELLQGSMSRHSDQYSLALVYHELLTGRLPFEAKNLRQLLVQRLTGEPDLGAVPVADRPLLTRALAKDPGQRFPSCLDFVQALLAVPQERPAAMEPGSTESPSPSGPGRRTRRGTRTSAAVQGSRAFQGEAPPVAPAPAAHLEPGTAPAEDQENLGDTAPGHAAAPSGNTAIPGYRFLDCLSQGSLGETWKVQGADGVERLARLLPVCAGGSAEAEAHLAARLRALRHPALPPTEVFQMPSGRVALLAGIPRQSLRDRFQECVAEGAPGIARPELLAYLVAAAEALDALHRQHGLAHLGLNPRNLLIDEGQVRVADFGLVPLVWLPSGEPAGPLNPRYAAPELFGKAVGPAADQYSLALIFAEMLTGVHPRGKQSGCRMEKAARSSKPDLALLPAHDREIVAQALHPDPRRRFPNCTALTTALEKAAVPADLYETLPPVIPRASLLGEPAPPGLVIPSARQLVTELIAAAGGSPEAGETGDVPYCLRPGAVLEHRFPIQSFARGVGLKLDGFRRQWNAVVVSSADNEFVYRVQETRSRWQRLVGGQTGLEIQVSVPPADADVRLTEVTVRIKPYGSNGALDAERLMAAAAPALLDSLRSYLQVGAERRRQERWPCDYPLQVAPVLPDLELAGEIEGTVKDLSLGGIGFVVPEAPASDRLYLLINAGAHAAEFALLARVLHVRQRAGGGVEIGAAFSAENE